MWMSLIFPWRTSFMQFRMASAARGDSHWQRSELYEPVRGKKNKLNLQIYEKNYWQHSSIHSISRSVMPKMADPSFGINCLERFVDCFFGFFFGLYSIRFIENQKGYYTTPFLLTLSRNVNKAKESSCVPHISRGRCRGRVKQLYWVIRAMSTGYISVNCDPFDDYFF